MNHPFLVLSLSPPFPPHQNEERISDDGSHQLDKVILVQSLEHESDAGKEGGGERGTKEQKQEDGKVKRDDEIKVELTVHQTEEEDIETIRIDQEEAKPSKAVKSETDSKKTIEKMKADGDQEVKSEETEGKEKYEDKPTLIVVEKAAVQDPSPIPSPGSKTEKEAPVARKLEAVEMTDGQGKEDDKPPPQVSKPDKLLPIESSPKGKDVAEDPSSQELNKSKSSQHHPDPVSSPSHPLKPLPNIDDGIMETKSEPRLPLLPPIGSKKITTLQSSGDALKSHSATGIAANVAITKEQVKEQPKGPTKKRKDGESAPSSDQASTKKKKKSADSLISTSGSSISKSKKSTSSSSNSTVSLGQKSKSRESLKSGPQNRLSTTVSKSSDNLANGAAKKLSISKESLKAASQVYSSVPAPKSGGELVKKGDSGGKGQPPKSKEVVKAEKERKSSDPLQKPPDKEDTVMSADSKAKEKMPESSSSEKKKDRDGSNQNDAAKKEPDSDTKETASLPTTVEKQATAISNNPPEEKEKTNNQVAVTITEPEEKTNTDDQSSADATPKKEAGKSTKTDKEVCGDTGENSGEKEVKSEAPNGSDKTEPTSTPDGVGDTEKEQIKAQEKSEIDSPPPKPTEESKTEGEKESDETPASSTPAKVEAPVSNAPTNVEVKIDNAKAKDDTSETTKPLEQAKEVVSKSPQPKDVSIKEPPAAAGPASETTSQISSSEFACKLEIDKKTGQSEQSIVEAVEKSTEPVVAARDVTTPA